MVKFSQMQGILCGGSLSLARALSHSTLLRSSVGALNILVLGLEMTSICLIKARKIGVQSFLGDEFQKRWKAVAEIMLRWIIQISLIPPAYFSA